MKQIFSKIEPGLLLHQVFRYNQISIGINKIRKIKEFLIWFENYKMYLIPYYYDFGGIVKEKHEIKNFLIKNSQNNIVFVQTLKELKKAL